VLRLTRAPVSGQPEPMKRHHKILVVGVLILLVGWLAWSVLLTESDMPQPPPVEQTG
jgi:hypothetical protein